MSLKKLIALAKGLGVSPYDLVKIALDETLSNLIEDDYVPEYVDAIEGGAVNQSGKERKEKVR